MKRSICLSFFICVLFSQATVATEGFFHVRNDLSYSLRSAWDSTLFVSPIEHGMLGAGFVVAKKTEHEKTVDYILTSGHVIESICGEFTGPCPNLLVSNLQVWDTTKKVDVIVDNKGSTNFGAEVVRISKSPDLALIKVIGEKKWQHLKPIPPAKNCEVNESQPVVLIGHPVLVTRTKWQLLAPSDLNVTLKRWSRGVMLETPFSSNKFDPAGNTWTATTADALEGNSGGPALNRQGEYVGSLDVLAQADGMAYDGQQTAQPMQWHSLLVSCQDIKHFVDSYFLAEDLKRSM